MSDTEMGAEWRAERTTFQRIYDVLVGTREYATVGEFAAQADCSESAARDALEQLSEWGIARRRDGRPAGYRRNDSYFRWRRAERLAREHSAAHLRERIEDLLDTDERFQNQYGVPDPGAVSTGDVPVADHDALHERWADLREWQTVRRDIVVLKRAVELAETQANDGVRA